MKLKNMDKEAIQKFLVDNGEKIVFGAVVLGCLLLVFLVRRGTFRDPPKDFNDLKTRADNAEKYCRGSSEKKPEEIEKEISKDKAWQTADFKAIAKRSKGVAGEDLYVHKVILDNPLFPQLRKRELPPLYPVEELRAAADRGPFSRAGVRAETGSGARGYRWVVLTGAVPVKNQLDVYKQTFAATQFRNAQTDVPKYKGYEVKRVEVAGRNSTEKIDWDKIEPLKVDEVIKKAALIGTPLADTVDPALVNPKLAFPLPPLADRPWGPQVLHEKLVGPTFEEVRQDPETHKGKKVVWQGDPTGQASDDGTVIVFALATTAAGRGGAQPATKERKRLFAVRFADAEAVKFYAKAGKIKGIFEGEEVVVGRDLVVVRTSAEEPATGTVWPLLKFDAPPVRADEREDGADDAEPDDTRPGVRPGPNRNVERQDVVDYQLFRFFDFGVQPGKYYRYCVRLELENPNRKVLERYLASPELNKDPSIFSAWVELPEPVAVPDDERLVALKVSVPTVGKRISVDPTTMTAHIRVLKWVESNGRKARTEPVPCHRGTLANGLKCTFQAEEAAKPARGAGRAPAAGDAAPRSLVVDTNAIVVDMRVERISDKENGPGEILLLDADGRLQLRDVTDGEKESHQFDRDAGVDTQADTTPEGKERPKTKTPAGPDDENLLKFN